MDLQLRGKTAIVTGGGSNIGRAIAHTFGREGANVAIAEIDQEQGVKVAREIESAGGSALSFRTDVTNLGSVETMFERVVDLFGQIHILVNDVGWASPRSFVETDPELWEKIISLNFRSDLNTLKVALPHMIQMRYGRIVNISSDAARIGEFHEAVYASCKAGVVALSKTIAREAGRHGITVNAVCPGLIRPNSNDEIGPSSMWQVGGGASTYVGYELTEKAKKAYPLGRLGTAQEIANVVVFLASDAASFVTGQTFSVNGGYTMI